MERLAQRRVHVRERRRARPREPLTGIAEQIGARVGRIVVRPKGLIAAKRGLKGSRVEPLIDFLLARTGVAWQVSPTQVLLVQDEPTLITPFAEEMDLPFPLKTWAVDLFERKQGRAIAVGLFLADLQQVVYVHEHVWIGGGHDIELS